jgi:DNA-directed RNA polymerase specialized sigma24 family protein
VNLPPEEIADIADHAVKSLIQRNGYFTDQAEYDDMAQSAIVRILEVDPSAIDSDPRGYLYRVAYHAAFDWLWWWEFGKTHAYCRYTRAPEVVDIDDVDIPEREPDELMPALSEAQQERLVGILLGSRSKRGSRGLAAAQRDVQIINLLVQGYENVGICQELGLPYNCINSYRFRIREALKSYVTAQ